MIVFVILPVAGILLFAATMVVVPVAAVLFAIAAILKDFFLGKS